MMKNFYVYIHRKATNGEVFYVGKGVGDRSSSRNNRNVHWQRIVAKHGYTIELVLDGLQEWYALELEKDLISLHGRTSDSTGILVNMTDGGDGISGYAHTDHARTQISKKNKGRVRSEEFCKNLSVFKKGNTNMLGKKLSTEARQKIVESNKIRRVSDETKLKMSKSKSKQVIRSDGVMYPSTVSASRMTGVPQSSISRCCSGKKDFAGGYSWSYVNV
jgi:hypothetical protein